MEVPEVLGEEEIELSLGLSIGGRNFKKFEKKSNHVDQKSISSITFDLQLFENDTESRMKNDDYSSPSCVCSLSVDDEGECEAVLDREKMRREIHRMRRQEARKKQLQKRNGRKDFDLMVRNEDEDGSEQQICKKLKSEEDDDVVVGEEKEQNLNQSFPIMPMQYVPFGNGFAFPYHHHHHHHHMMQSWIPPASSSDRDDNNNVVVHPIVCRSFKPIQFENSVLNRDCQLKNCDFEQNVSRCGGDKAATATATTRSSGSAGSSSSGVSDYGNGSQHGGSSCETRSHSSQSPPPEQPQSNVPVMSNVQVQSELNTSSNPAKSILVFEKTNTNANNIVCSNDAQSNPSKTEGKQVPVIDPHPIDKPNTVTDYPLPAFLRPDQHSKGDNVENFKPPKLQPPRQLNRTNEEASKPLTSEPPHQPTGTHGEGNLVAPKLTQSPRLLKRTNEEASKPFIPKPPHQLTETNGESNLITPKPTQPQTESLPRMPCVSTVGKGPNGKTVTGFLYRYTKTEVSIICVCHGSSFSPAEFVKHAGGTDVSHPLKDIVVVP